MWSINPSPSSSAFSNSKLFSFSNLNLDVPLFRSSLSLAKGDSPTKIVPTRPPIVRNTQPILPIGAEDSLLYVLEGFWSNSSLTKVNSVNLLTTNSYIWLYGKTFVISNSNTRLFTTKKEVIITNPLNLGIFDEGVVTKVVAGGLVLDFTLLNEEVVVATNSKSCLGRIGQVAEIYLEKQINPNEYSTKPIKFFSKADTGVSVATLFSYLGYNYSISNTLEAFTLVNTINNKFFIVLEEREYTEISNWLLSGGIWNDSSIWNDDNTWED